MFAQTDGHNANVVNATAGTPYEEKKQPNKCRDPLFAVLFYVNLAVIIGIAAIFGSNPFNEAKEDNQDADADEEVDIDYKPFLFNALLSGGGALALSLFALQLLLCIPEILIKVALITNIILTLLTAAAAFYYGQMVMAIICGILFLLTCCYTYCIWSRIPFATANLKTGCTAVKANCGVTILAYAVVVFAFAWTLLWTVSILGIQDSLYECYEVNGEKVCSNPNYLFLFLLFVSYFFTHQVLQNTVHTTIAGVVGTWWFVPDESGFCGSAVLGSFWRTITTSFGSVCFGSLLVAIIEATRQIIESMKNNDDIGAALACCIDCLLGCIQGLVEYFNKWAYVYVGLYGYGYCEAGKNVMQLFADRGWEAVIADDIIGTVLTMMSLGVGLITSGVAILLSKWTDMFDNVIASYDGDDSIVLILCGLIGFVMGFALCSIVMGVISSSVNATIVLFAEAPAEFEAHHPELSREMRNAYLGAHPGCM
jgi:hypothetical protein